MPVSREDVEFSSCGATLRGWLFRPLNEHSVPGVVLAHGLSAVREMFLDRYAEAFADAGFAALAYDHVGFGASDGEPRQSAVAQTQMAGYRDAIAWLGDRPDVDVDRIGLWGTSYSGGEVIALAAEQLPIRCAVAQVPVFGDGRPDTSPATAGAIRDALRSGRLDDAIPATSPTPDGLGLMYRDGAHDWFARVAAQRAPRWRNELRAGSFAEPFRPIDSLPSVVVPLLLIVAPDDTLVAPAAGVAVAERTPLVEVARIPGNHFDAYEAGFEQSSQLAVDWFARHLSGA